MSQTELVSDGRKPAGVSGSFSYSPPGYLGDPDVWVRGALTSMFKASQFNVHLEAKTLSVRRANAWDVFGGRNPYPAEFVGAGVIEVVGDATTAHVQYKFAPGPLAIGRSIIALAVSGLVTVSALFVSLDLSSFVWFFGGLGIVAIVYGYCRWRETLIGDAMLKHLRDMAHDN